MKDRRDIFLALLAAAMVIETVSLSVERRRIAGIENETVHDTIYVENTWQRLIGAIILVESEGNPKAVNSRTGATGCLQLRETYVREANRILGEDRYTYDDRFDPEKSVEMFNIVQDHHNPEHDLRRATYLHNRPYWYHERVMKRMKEL